ncbi:hypothetical protein IP88_05170 [alpha proteobacterium AAP81b]|nr:hypothetical protein IP88_05170 [alpha proteobacterium AAP81b]
MIIDDDIAAALLAPIGGGEIAAAVEGVADASVGVDGRVDEGAAGDAFRELRFQRKAIYRIETRVAMGGDPPADGESWDWETLAEAAIAYLTDEAKDLEIMAMLLEAAVRLDGLPGLARATQVLADMVKAFWDAGLWPAEDEEDGVEARFQPMSGLSGGSGDKDGTLILPLRRLVLASNASGDSLQFIDRVIADGLFADAQTAGTPEKRGQLNREAEAALEAQAATARRLGAKALKPAVAQLAASEAAWRGAVAEIFGRTRPKAPAASRVSDELKNMGDWLKAFLKELPDDAPVFEAEVEGDAAVAAGVPAAGVAAAGAPFSIGRIDRREDALRAIAAAADYFERLEPVSPLGHALREVDRRARMSLDAFLEEVIPDSGTRELFYWRSGIKPPAKA